MEEIVWKIECQIQPELHVRGIRSGADAHKLISEHKETARWEFKFYNLLKMSSRMQCESCTDLTVLWPRSWAMLINKTGNFKEITILLLSKEIKKFFHSHKSL